ncbi:UBX domain-containing protein 8-B, putative [Entamoeba dispar SAW760]|uniref:UBX domain-containing protein 8-B, putative n=1 Tax=Entamoeba dispar (strain ATCC PRA-260 / SAW760) TaxID=370354 RepID=B0EG39_ENTDS|nr:UBX domain-containing protein 8-B, putative [Entamoeba dispar SAW760]EDR26506.1 UBX domain-containing protein 8-B, putative [Entamoeba dispar SAW760]|eukprot:EDR26506.1 UBX domain-containing protein 8-B, putative [Entamoeba dispar SAW760]
MEYLINFLQLNRFKQLKHELDSYQDEFNTLFNDYHNNFQQTFQQCKSQCKLMLIFHHSPQSPLSLQSLSSLLRNNQLIQTINQYYLIFISNVNTEIGHKLEEIHDIASFPSISIVFPFNGVSGQLLTVLKHNEFTSDTLIKIAIQHTNLFNEIIEERRIKEERQRIREEQEQEYKKALEEAKRQEEREQKIQEELLRIEEKKIQEEERQKNEEMKKQIEKEEILNDMKRKKQIFEQEQEPNGKDTCIISVRFPNGKKIQRRFNKTDKIQKLYDFVDANQSATRNYSLVRLIPKKRFERKEITFEEEKLYPSAMLVVELN